MKNLSSVSRKNAENGFVLVTSLIFLVVITLLAVSAISSSTLQERMASNLRDKSHARQDADAALRRAENLLRQAPFNTYQPAGTCYPGSAPSKTDCEQTTGALRLWTEDQIFNQKVTDYSIAFLDPKVWGAPEIQTYTAEADHEPVQFFVEDMPSAFQCRDLDPDHCARGQGSAFYRITARAHGANPAAIAVTQSLYEKHY